MTARVIPTILRACCARAWCSLWQSDLSQPYASNCFWVIYCYDTLKVGKQPEFLWEKGRKGYFSNKKRACIRRRFLFEKAYSISGGIGIVSGGGGGVSTWGTPWGSGCFAATVAPVSSIIWCSWRASRTSCLRRSSAMRSRVGRCVLRSSSARSWAVRTMRSTSSSMSSAVCSL